MFETSFDKAADSSSSEVGLSGDLSKVGTSLWEWNDGNCILATRADAQNYP